MVKAVACLRGMSQIVRIHLRLTALSPRGRHGDDAPKTVYEAEHAAFFRKSKVQASPVQLHNNRQPAVCMPKVTAIKLR
jgi:hypothetical protein